MLAGVAACAGGGTIHQRARDVDREGRAEFQRNRRGIPQGDRCSLHRTAMPVGADGAHGHCEIPELRDYWTVAQMANG